MNAARVVGAFLRRDWRIQLTYRTSFALMFVHPLTSLIVFYYLTAFVDQQAFREASDISGSYFGFVVVGLAVMGIFEVGVVTFADTIRREQSNGTLEILFATPTLPFLIIISSAVFAFVKAILTGIFMLLAAVAVFGLDLDVSDELFLGLGVALPCCLVLFAAVGVAIAGVTLVIKQTAGLAGFASIAVSLLSGVYYPTAVFPAPLEAIADAIPVTWGIEIIRAGLLGGEADLTRLAGLLACAVASVPVAGWVFRLALDRARREGSLGQY